MRGWSSFGVFWQVNLWKAVFEMPFCWERMQEETEPAFEAFRCYLGMPYSDIPTGRSLSKLAQKLGKSKTLLDRWSAVHRWQERCRAYDREIQGEELEARKRRATMGRPRKQIDKTEFEKLCCYQFTEKELAAWFGVNVDTILAWCKRTYGMSFSEIFRQKRVIGNILLRKIQWDMAKKSPTMAIFLGKNYLGQKDKAVIASDTDERKVIVHFYDGR